MIQEYTKKFIEEAISLKIIKKFNKYRETTYLVDSSTVKDKKYEVIYIDVTKRWICECPSKCYHSKKKDCKHIIRVLYEFDRPTFYKRVTIKKDGI